MLRVPVTPEERELIEQKMVLLHTRNFFSLRLPIDGYIVNMDTTDIQVQTAEIQKIGANVNQIAKRLNSMGPVYVQDIEDIKGCWRRYGSYKDTSYQVNAEKSPGLH